MTAVVAVIAILVTMLLIAWARLEVHGADDLAALVYEAPAAGSTPAGSTISNSENEAASSRWATGFSH